MQDDLNVSKMKAWHNIWGVQNQLFLRIGKDDSQALTPLLWLSLFCLSKTKSVVVFFLYVHDFSLGFVFAFLKNGDVLTT